MTYPILLDQLKQLKLSGMVEALREQQEQPMLHDLAFEERLAFLLDRELMARKNKKVSYLLRQAKLRQQACVENIDYQHPRQLQKSHMASLITCDFIQHHHNLFITGPTGCGKSYLACAIGQQACRQGLSVKYLRVPRFLEELTLAHADGSYTACLNRLLKMDLLILDDFGLQPGLTVTQRTDLFNLIEDRHQLKSTLITSQLPVKHWHDYIGEPTTADAILDRLVQHAQRIELKGGSMRQSKS